MLTRRMMLGSVIGAVAALQTCGARWPWSRCAANSRGQTFNPPCTFSIGFRDQKWFLDCGIIDGQLVLLDGQGNPLGKDREPVYLPFNVA